MRKLLVAFFLLIGLVGNAQLQKPNTRGYELRNVIVDSFFALPADTFAVPTDIRTFPFMARKGTTTYLWNTSTFTWGALAGSSSLVDSIWREAGKDSIFWSKAGNTYKIKDSTGGGGLGMKARRSIEIVSDSAQLVNDSASFASGAVKVYGYDVTRGWKDAAKLVLTDPQAKDGLYYDSGDWVNISALNKRVQFEIGVTTNAPAAGDSVLVNTEFPGKDIKVYRDGLRQYEDTTDGVEFIGGDSIVFHPPFSANERFIIETLDTALWSTFSLNPIPAWSNLTFTTKTSGMSSTDSTWSFTGSAWDQYGLADQYLEANTDGMIRFKYHATAGQFQSIGFKLVNSNGSYTTMKWGAMINPNSLYRVVDGAITNQGYNASVGDYIVIRRTGSTIYLQTTTDNVTYTTRHTFSTTSSDRLYIVYNVYAAQTGYYPKGFNVQ